MESIQEDVYQRASIRFPKPLTLEKSEEMLKFVSEALPGQFHTNSSYGSVIGSRYSHLERQGRTSVTLMGLVTRIKGSLAFDSFRFHNTEGDALTFQGLTFDVIPGYSIEDHGPAKIELWDDVRRCVHRYFNPGDI